MRAGTELERTQGIVFDVPCFIADQIATTRHAAPPNSLKESLTVRPARSSANQFDVRRLPPRSRRVAAGCPAFASPLPSVTEPFQSTSTCRSNVAIDSSRSARPAGGALHLFLSARDAQLHAGADQPEHDPRNRPPSLPRRRRHRIQNPDVAG